MSLPPEIYICRACGLTHTTIQPACLSCAACSWAALPNPELHQVPITRALMYLLLKAVRLNLTHMRRMK